MLPYVLCCVYRMLLNCNLSLNSDIISSNHIYCRLSCYLGPILYSGIVGIIPNPSCLLMARQVGAHQTLSTHYMIYAGV